MMKRPENHDREPREAALEELLRRDAGRVRAVPPADLKARVLREVERQGRAGRPVTPHPSRTTELVGWLALAAAALLVGFLRFAGTDERAPGPAPQELAAGPAHAGVEEARPLATGPLVARGTRRMSELTRAMDGALVGELENLFLDFRLAAERVAERLPLPRPHTLRAD